MKIYVASSWRCERQPVVVAALRGLGHDVYDFRNPTPGDSGFGWHECATPEQLRDPRRFRDEVLTSQQARRGFESDMAALLDADATVLVLPCGRSAHLELGYAVGAGQKTYVLLDDPMSEPELMYLMCTKILCSLDELMKTLAIPAPPVVPPADRSQRTLTDGGLTEDEARELKPGGQQKAYVILTEEERKKGFVRPVRRSYKHVGVPPPPYPTRLLTADEQARYAQYNYELYMEYPPDVPERQGSAVGRFYTKLQLFGCGGVTTMSREIAETYARDPGFYSGTFCATCGEHYPVGERGEFVWVDGGTRVGT